MEVVVPEIIFESGWLLDDSLAEISKTELNQEAIDEIVKRTPEFQTAWNDLGRPLLSSVIKKNGIFFREKDIKCFLIYGPIYGGLSHPLIINVKRYLHSLQEKPTPLSDFVEVAFHVLLHILLQDNARSWPTPMIQNYMEDGFEVIAHLHLMALQRKAHENAGSRIDWLNDWYGKMGESYSKTWKAVSDDAVYEGLLKELSTEFGSSGSI